MIKKILSLFCFCCKTIFAQNEDLCNNQEFYNINRISRVEFSNNDEYPYAIYWEKINNDNNIDLNNTFTIIRCLGLNKTVVIGKGVSYKIVYNETMEGLAIANNKAHQSLSDELKTYARYNNLYWRPMQGDFLIKDTIHIEEKLVFIKQEKFAWSDIFENNNGKYDYELSEKGRKLIINAASQILQTQNGKLLIEVNNNSFGNRDEIREDTQIRAQEIAKMLSAKFNLNDNSFVAIGLGADNLENTNTQKIKVANFKFKQGVVLRIMPK